MKLYVVQSKDGKYFRPSGYNGDGKQWQDSIEKAKFYAKIGPAKAQCTIWFKHSPKRGCPKILEFELKLESAKVIDVG